MIKTESRDNARAVVNIVTTIVIAMDSSVVKSIKFNEK